MNAKYLKLFWFQVFRPLTGSPSSKYVVYATAYVYRELYVKITDGKKNNNERYEIIVSSTCFIYITLCVESKRKEISTACIK